MTAACQNVLGRHMYMVIQIIYAALVCIVTVCLRMGNGSLGIISSINNNNNYNKW